MILIDIGNTRIKWAQQKVGKLGEMNAVLHLKQDFSARLKADWQQLPKPNKIFIACVSSVAIKQQVMQVALQLWPDVYLKEIHTTKVALGVSNAYPKFNKLGVDRWLSLIAGYRAYTSPVCIVACGTAITLDIVDREGKHLGGMIMPGLNLMKVALSNSTANLSFDTEHFPQGLAKDTEAAIYNGNLNAVRGFIDQGLASYPEPLQLILTGGDAEFLVDALCLSAKVDAELVLKGLALIASEISLS